MGIHKTGKSNDEDRRKKRFVHRIYFDHQHPLGGDFKRNLDTLKLTTIRNHCQQQDKTFWILGPMVEDLTFEHDYYCPRPKTINGEPYFEKVYPYNACYLPDHDEQVDRRNLDPV